jgi:hypothetical protein
LTCGTGNFTSSIITSSITASGSVDIARGTSISSFLNVASDLNVGGFTTNLGGLLNVAGRATIGGLITANSDLAVTGQIACAGNIIVGDALTDFVQSPNFNIIAPFFASYDLFINDVNDYGDILQAVNFSSTPAAAALLFGKQQIQLTVSYLLGSSDVNNDTRGTFQFKGCSLEEFNQGFPFGSLPFNTLVQPIFIPRSVGDAFVCGTQMVYLRKGIQYRSTDTVFIIRWTSSGGRLVARVNNGNNMLGILGMF